VKYGMVADEKFAERTKDICMLKTTEGKLHTIQEWIDHAKINQTDKNGETVVLYSTDTAVQHMNIKAAKDKGYEVVVLNGPLDTHFAGWCEGKFEKVKFRCVDGGPMDQLIELQKQIVTATWKLARPPQPGFDAKISESLKIIQESQKKGIEQLESLKERITNPSLVPILSVIGERMTDADKSLGEAIADFSMLPLGAASVAEQGAYQGLLKLRAKEHLMMKSQQSGSGSSGSSSVSQEQMAQLELDNKQNRYELQRSAQKQADSSQREELAVLDRLKELARRQQPRL